MEGSVIRTEIAIIGPDKAAMMLERDHPGNRAVSMAAVDRFAYDMKRGKFESLNGETVIVHRDGTLLDGQHRLWAVTMAGVELPFLVTVVDGDKDEILKTIDNGRKRTVGDFLNVKNRNIVSSIGRQAYLFENSESPLLTNVTVHRGSRYAPSRDEVLGYIERHLEELEMVASDAMAIRRNIGCGSASAIGEALWLGRHYGDGTVYRRFVDAMCDAVPACPTAASAIGSIRKSHLNGSKLAESEFVARILWAYDAFAEGGTATRINGSKAFGRYAEAVRLRRQAGGA